MIAKTQPNETQLINDHMRLVVFLANRFRPYNMEYTQWEQIKEDYVQVGQIGLLKAIRAYDPKRSKSLTTVAWLCIYREILRFVQTEKRQQHIYLFYDVPDKTYKPTENSLWEISPNSLSKLERQILEYKCEGYTYKEIGVRLGYTKAWVNRIFRSATEKIKKANI